MFRALVTAAALGLAVVTATTAPASATALDQCFSVDLRCQGYECESGADPIFNNGVNDVGPWLVVCPVT